MGVEVHEGDRAVRARRRRAAAGSAIVWSPPMVTSRAAPAEQSSRPRPRSGRSPRRGRTGCTATSPASTTCCSANGATSERRVVGAQQPRGLPDVRRAEASAGSVASPRCRRARRRSARRRGHLVEAGQPGERRPARRSGAPASRRAARPALSPCSCLASCRQREPGGELQGSAGSRRGRGGQLPAGRVDLPAAGLPHRRVHPRRRSSSRNAADPGGRRAEDRVARASG